MSPPLWRTVRIPLMTQCLKDPEARLFAFQIGRKANRASDLLRATAIMRLWFRTCSPVSLPPSLGT